MIVLGGASILLLICRESCTGVALALRLIARAGVHRSVATARRISSVSQGKRGPSAIPESTQTSATTHTTEPMWPRRNRPSSSKELAQRSSTTFKSTSFSVYVNPHYWLFFFCKDLRNSDKILVIAKIGNTTYTQPDGKKIPLKIQPEWKVFFLNKKGKYELESYL